MTESHAFNERVLKVAKVTFAFGVAFLVITQAPSVLLLLFAGMLLAIFLTSLASWFGRATRFSYGWALAAVCLLLAAFAAAAVVVAAPRVAGQIDELTERLPRSLEQLRGRLEHYSWARSLSRGADWKQIAGGGASVVSRATGALSGLLGGIASLVVVAFVGLYGAAEPGVYKRGFVALVPVGKRKRAVRVIDEVNEVLRWWLTGKLFSMAIIGALTTAGLWLMGVPLALSLGLIAALLTFIPNVGPLISAVPAVLLGLTGGLERGLYIALLYLGIQTVESYLITPLIQRKTIHLPPALTLASQALLGVLVGGIGLAMATPLTAAAIVVTKRLYVEDALGDELPTKRAA